MRQLRYFCVFAFKSSCVVCCCEKKNLGIGGAVGLGESEEATVAVATICICVICICVFPLLIEKHIGGMGAGGLEKCKKGGKIGVAKSFIYLFFVLFCFFVCIFHFFFVIMS